jgi:chromosome partitioning protein
MNIISIASNKGGVAKTVTTVHLGAALASAGYSTLLLDLDLQHGLTTYFDVDLDGRKTMDDALLDNTPLQECILHLRDGLDLAPSTSRMEVADKELPHRAGGDLRLRAALRGLRERSLKESNEYSFVLIDCPGTWGAVVRNAILASTHMLIPINSEPAALKSGIETEVLAREAAQWNDHDLQLLGALLTCTRSSKIAKAVAAGTMRQWPHDTMSTQIRRAERINELHAYGATLYDNSASRDNPLREDYELLAQEVISRCRPPRSNQRSSKQSKSHKAQSHKAPKRIATTSQV